MYPYSYERVRDELFTEHGQRLFIGIRDHAKVMLKNSGSFTMGAAMILPTGVGAADSFLMMACVDRMVELGEIREIHTHGAGQNRVFVAP